MTKEEYLSELSLLRKRAKAKEYLLMEQYAMSNNPYRIGDVIQDHIGSIKIESIRAEIEYISKLPACVYLGTEVKKDGSPKKKSFKRAIYQSNVGQKL